MVTDFNRGKMAETLTCASCHGSKHNSEENVDQAVLPTIATCKRCHARQARQYLDGKHALGKIAMDAMPRTHQQPKAFIEGQKGCGGCHTMGLAEAGDRETENQERITNTEWTARTAIPGTPFPRPRPWSRNPA